MTNAYHYTMLIQWSDEDDAYLVSFPEWEGIVFNPITHGDTYAEAVSNGEEALEGLIVSLTKEGEALPTPKPIVVAA